MKRFIIRGSIQNNQVVFNVKELNFQQRKFVQACVVQLNNNPAIKKATDNDSLAFVMYNNSEDFAGGLLVGVKSTPDAAWQEQLDLFNKKTSKYPQVGFTYTRDEIVELGTEYAGRMYDMLNEGGQWPWPNARAVFQKTGDKLVVVETL